MIKQFDKPTLRALRADLDAALAAVAAKHGIAVRVGNASFMPNTATFKLELATKGDDGAVVTKEAQAFRQLAGSYGLAPTDLGREVTLSGDRFRIIGLRAAAIKRPILLEMVGDEKRRVVTNEVDVQRALA